MIFSFRTRLLTALLLTVVIAGCAGPYQNMPSSNVGERIKTVVIHYTAIDYQESVRVLVDEDGLSAHYLVTDPNDASYSGGSARVIQLVDESKRAWHAGKSHWQGRNHLNDTSIGIEIINIPHCETSPEFADSPSEHSKHRLCTYPDYPPRQIEQIVALMQGILARNPDIEPTSVVGHADIAFMRKSDPGPRFPWHQLYLAGIGAWYEQDALQSHWQKFFPALPSTGLLQAALNAYGYGVTETGIMDVQTLSAISAFQMHFVQDKVTGSLNNETAAALFALLQKYFPTKHKKLMTRYASEQQMQTTSKPKVEVIQGQIDAIFPQQERSSREDVNDKMAFKAYAGAGELIITPSQTTQADIEINGERLILDTPLEAGNTYAYSLKRRTHNGVNTFALKGLSQPEHSINVTLPWPVLGDATAKWQSAFSKVDAQITADINDGFPGAVLLVIKDGHIIKRTAYGDALKYDENGDALISPQPMTPETLFDVASNTKMFATNLALMKLVSEGRLNVDAPVQRYLPEYTRDGRDARTVRDLLSHHSGYAPGIPFFEPGNGSYARLKSRNRVRTSSLLTTAVPFFEGNRQHTTYSDTNFMLLGLLVERITGMALDRYCEQFLYAPLRLNHTLFNPLQKGVSAADIAATEINGNTRSRHVKFPGIRTYTLRGEVHDEKAWYSMDGVSGHAGLFSNVDDFAVLMQTLINGGGYDKVRLFDKDTLSLFTAPSTADPGFGLGWRRAADGRNRWHFGPYASSTAFGHTGWTGTVTVIDPEQELAIVLFTNARHTRVEKTPQGGLQFSGSDFETAKYGSVITGIYEAVLDQ